jgi:hypothetical protein
MNGPTIANPASLFNTGQGALTAQNALLGDLTLISGCFL